MDLALMLSGLYKTPRSGMPLCCSTAQAKESCWVVWVCGVDRWKKGRLSDGWGTSFCRTKRVSVINRFTRALPFRLHLISSPHFTPCAHWPLGIVASSWYTVTNGEVSEITLHTAILACVPTFCHFKNFFFFLTIWNYFEIFLPLLCLSFFSPSSYHS